MTGLRDGTTSLKYKAQRERRVPNSSHILLMENKLRKFFVIQKDANLCLKCTKIRLPARLRPDPPGELKQSPRPSSCNQGILLLMALKEVALCRFGPLKFDAWSALGERTVLYKNIVLSFCF